MGNCSCNRNDQLQAPGFDAKAHVSCTCAREALRAAGATSGIKGRIEEPLDEITNGYATAGGDMPAVKWKKAHENTACDDTDPLVGSPLKGGKSIHVDHSTDHDFEKSCLTDVGADAWHLPLESAAELEAPHSPLKGEKRAKFSNSVLAIEHRKHPSGVVENGVKEDELSRQETFDETDQDSGTDIESEQEPAPMQRPRKGGVCCAGVVKGAFTPPFYKKDEDTVSRLRKILKNCMLFRALKADEFDNMVGTISLQSYKKGERIFRQGDFGDCMFIILSGSIDCHREQVRRKSVESSTSSRKVERTSSAFGPDKRGQFICTREAGTIFGELAIMWNTPRSLSAYAREACTLGRLQADVYQSCVVQRTMRFRTQIEDLLKKVKMLETLNEEQFARVADALEVQSYKGGRPIITQGEEGKELFIMLSGEAVAKIFFAGMVQEHRRYHEGDLFGEVALLHNKPRAATIEAVTRVEVLRLSRRSFERLLGSLSLLQQDSYKTDPRKLIADFYKPGDTRGPLGSLLLQDPNLVEPDTPNTQWFAVFRPTSRDAIAKMLNGNAVGKGLNVKGKSAKKNRLSGYVPFVQISCNEHKHAIEKFPDNIRIRVFYRTEAARTAAFERLTLCKTEMIGGSPRKACSDHGSDGISHSCSTSSSKKKAEVDAASKTSMIKHSISDKDIQLPAVDSRQLEYDDSYKEQKVYGLLVPGNLLYEVYIMRADLSPLVEWETGRRSEPAFMDMNMHAVTGDTVPEVVLYQHDEGDPLNPRGLLIAYAEKLVKPVVSDFDAFLVASKGMAYAELASEQREIMAWSIRGAHEILKNKGSVPWTSRWLAHLKTETQNGFHPTVPPYGFGDPTSVRLISDVVQQTSACGAVRHGAECFNYHFPQELDEEYLVVWQGFEGVPWVFKTEPELRQFLIERVRDGFSFPVNPVWAIRDPGWYEVLAALRNLESAKENLNAWYSGDIILHMIDEIHKEFPDCFCEVADDSPVRAVSENNVRVEKARGSDSESNIDMTLHMLQNSSAKTKPSRRTLKITAKPSSWMPTSFFSRFRRKKKKPLLQSPGN